MYEPSEHAVACSGLYGAYLMIKRCQIALFMGQKYTLKDAPFVNDHFERDSGLRRGKPLVVVEVEVEEWKNRIIEGDICHLMNRIQYEANRFEMEAEVDNETDA